MAVITFLSDFGEKDHYVAAVKASLISINPGQQIIDLTHKINRHDIGHGAYVLKNIFRNFPEGSVHLVAIDPVIRSANRLVAVELDGHFFVGFDSGIYSLISQGIAKAVRLENRAHSFPTRDILGPAAARLANGTRLTSVGEEINDLQTKTDRQIKATRREIVGQIIHIDHYGNLVTNIQREVFEKICEINGGDPAYLIRFGREVFRGLHGAVTDVDGGDCFVLFNSYGHLEIGINKGRASDLLGLRQDAPVIIEFNT